MNEEDNEYLFKVYKGLAMVGFLMNGDYTVEEIPRLSTKLAKAMMEEEPEHGITAVKPKLRRSK
jgi:hypothetical protein